MAELTVKIGDGAGYSDGDVISAYNRRAIGCRWAEFRCHPKFAARERGRIVPGGVAQDWFEATHAYRFERVSETEIRRVEIATGKEETFGPTPNARGERVDVPLFIARRLAHPNNRIFGAPGAELWYGGRQDRSAAAVAKVWTAIEKKTAFRRADHEHWPRGAQELKSHLVLPVDEFDDAEARALVAPELGQDRDGFPVILRKRTRAVAWRALLPRGAVSEGDVLDRTKAIDLRLAGALERAALVTVKPRG